MATTQAHNGSKRITDLLRGMQAYPVANDLVARAARRHLGKSDREAGELSVAQGGIILPTS